MMFAYGDVITLPDSTVHIMVIKPIFDASSDAMGIILVAEKRSGPTVAETIWGNAGEHTFLNTEHKDWKVVK